MTAKLFASFSPNPDRPMVMIYGNPEGLKSLAEKLWEYAEHQQSHIGHDPGEHWHLFPGNHGLVDSSFEIMISRMDDRNSGETEWCDNLLTESQQRLRIDLEKRFIE